ncbi:ABA4-like family protein [bacterium]|nr:ABA4-like family protein [bacterium]
MIEQISAFFTIEMIYFWLSFGILPFWFVLIFFPQSRICGIFVTSIFPFLILGSVYIYLFYYFFTNGYNFLENFELYLGIYNLVNLFEQEAFLILIWIHFLAINLFCATWIVRDSQKYFMSKYLNLIPLLITYFVGPVGIVLYWIIRIFFAKKISLFD